MSSLHHYVQILQTYLRAMSLRRASTAPKRDWYALLVSTLVLAVVLVVGGLYEYHLSGRVVRDVPTTDSEESKLPDADALADAIGLYRERAMTFESLRTTPRPAPSVGVELHDAVVAEEGGEVDDLGESSEGDVPPVRAD